MTSEHPLQNHHKLFYKDLFFKFNYSDRIGFSFLLCSHNKEALEFDRFFFFNYVCNLYEALSGCKVVYLLKDGLPNILT